MIREAAGVAKGAQKPSREIVGSVTIDQLREIAEYKMNDLNAGTLDAAISMLKGTARNMGIEVKEAGASNKEEGDN
jgi:large subunit ribosomal protein L11